MTTFALEPSGIARFEIPRSASTSEVRELRSSMRRALQAGERRLVVDCGAVSQLDVRVLSSLVQCATACREHGIAFEIANVSAELREDLRALQLERRLGLKE